jgi:hypothetical protein
MRQCVRRAFYAGHWLALGRAPPAASDAVVAIKRTCDVEADLELELKEVFARSGNALKVVGKV